MKMRQRKARGRTRRWANLFYVTVHGIIVWPGLYVHAYGNTGSVQRVFRRRRNRDTGLPTVNE